jgi:hypothetical protein
MCDFPLLQYSIGSTPQNLENQGFSSRYATPATAAVPSFRAAGHESEVRARVCMLRNGLLCCVVGRKRFGVLDLCGRRRLVIQGLQHTCSVAKLTF